MTTNTELKNIAYKMGWLVGSCEDEPEHYRLIWKPTDDPDDDILIDAFLIDADISTSLLEVAERVAAEMDTVPPPLAALITAFKAAQVAYYDK